MKENLLENPSDALNSLASDAATEDQNDSFMEPKKKRGRPKGSTKAKKDTPPPGKTSLGGDLPPSREEQIAQTKKYLKPAVGVLSSVGVKMAEDERAAMSPEEMEIITESAAACINQYLPDVLGAHANAVVLAAALANWGVKVWLLRMAKLEEMRERQARMKNVTPPPETPVN